MCLLYSISNTFEFVRDSLFDFSIFQNRTPDIDINHSLFLEHISQFYSTFILTRARKKYWPAICNRCFHELSAVKSSLNPETHNRALALK